MTEVKEEKDLIDNLRKDYFFGETPIEAYFRWRKERIEAAEEIERLRKVELEHQFLLRYFSKGE